MKKWSSLICKYWQLIVLALTVSLLLAGCGGGGGGTTPPVSPPSPPF